MKNYTLYLDTSITNGWNVATKLKAYDSGTVSWLIDWDNLFGKTNDYKTCNVRFNLIGKSSDLDNYTYNNIGCLRANLPSVFQNQINMTALGMCLAELDQTDTIKARLVGDTLMSHGVTIQIPRGFSQFTLQIIGVGEETAILADDYIILLSFEAH
jgi:hypothetical protein